MADGSKIEWTDATWNPIRARNKKTGKVGWHCEHATTGCAGCYAEGLNLRLGTGLPFKPGHLNRDVELFLDQDMLLRPLSWKRPRMIFICSMTDLFADFVPDEWIDQIFAVMALTPRHTFHVLTKRAKRMHQYIDDALGRVISRAEGDWPGWPLPNVWLGVSTEQQQEADERIPELLATPAAVRFISAEPLLGPLSLESIYVGREIIKPLAGATWYPTPADWPRQGITARHSSKLDWVIVGGESGPKARPMHPDWARSLRDQCKAAGVPFFFKQWGEWGMPTASLGDLDWPYHPDHDRTHWFDRRTCVRPIERGWSDKYHDGGGALPPPPFNLFQTPEFLDQVSRCPQDDCSAAGKCIGNLSRAAVTRVGKKKAGRLLDSIEHNELPKRGTNDGI